MGLFSRVLQEFNGFSSKGMKPFTYLLLEDGNKSTKGALISYDKESSAAFRETSRTGSDGPLGSSYKGIISSSIVDQLCSAIPTAATALQTGSLFQFTASPAALNALGTGNASLMANQFGLSGIIQGSSNKIIEHGGFNPASSATIVAPLIAWQIVHAVFAVSHLQKINLKLEQIIRGIEDLVHRSQAKTYGQIWASAQAVKDILRQQEHGGVFTDDMRVRLAVASQTLLSAIAEQSMLLQRYIGEFDQITSLGTKAKNTKVALQQLKETGPKFQLDAHLYTAAGHASMMSTQAWILHDLQHAPENVERRLDDLGSDLKEIIIGIEPLEKYEELSEYAVACSKEMNWFQRHIINHGTYRDAGKLEKKQEDREATKQKTSDEGVSLYFWNDEGKSRPTCIAVTDGA